MGTNNFLVVLYMHFLPFFVCFSILFLFYYCYSLFPFHSILVFLLLFSIHCFNCIDLQCARIVAIYSSLCINSLRVIFQLHSTITSENDSFRGYRPVAKLCCRQLFGNNYQQLITGFHSSYCLTLEKL